MNLDDWLLDILACPNCHGTLRADEARMTELRDEVLQIVRHGEDT